MSRCAGGRRAFLALASLICAMCAFSACSARVARSAGLSSPSGSTSRSNLAGKAIRVGKVRAGLSDVLAHDTCAPARPRSAAESFTWRAQVTNLTGMNVLPMSTQWLIGRDGRQRDERSHRSHSIQRGDLSRCD